MTTDTQQSFADYGIRDDVVRALAEKGITHPFPIQALTLGVALERHDIIGQAKTGTGKTLGFGLPMIETTIPPSEIEAPEGRAPQGLVVVPTRELAQQVASDLKQASKYRGLVVVDMYGGRAYEPQIEALKKGTDIVVGTPGRLIDLMRHKVLNLSKIRTLVLDEADEMLDLGFLEDVETIISATPAQRHTMLFSATMPGPVVAMARRYMDHPTHIRAQDPEDSGSTVKTTKQFIYRCHQMNKEEVLARILQARGRGLAIVFTRTKRQAATLVADLSSRGFAVGALHGDLGQGAREQALRAFRKGKIDILVATDVAARGIDVDDVTHVINYQCPEDEKTYLHRIGRTGRAGNTGTAITFVDWEDTTRWAVINRILDLGIPQPVETYHTSEHLFTDLDIPADADGKLPKAQRTRAGLDAEECEDLGETGRSHGGRSGRGGRGRKGGRRSSSSGDSRTHHPSREEAASRKASRSGRGAAKKSSSSKGTSAGAYPETRMERRRRLRAEAAERTEK